MSLAEELPEATKLVESFDPLAGLRHGLKRAAEARADWAGIPMPLGKDHPLMIEPHFPNAKELMQFGREEEEAPPAEDCPTPPKWRNTFWSTHRRSEIHVFEISGRVEHGLQPAAHSLTQQLNTLGASVAWGIEQESNALQLLARLLPHHAFKKYLLTGAFLEASERSRVTYMFRRLRPTVALVADEDRMRILCALCMHPIAYYQKEAGL